MLIVIGPFCCRLFIRCGNWFVLHHCPVGFETPLAKYFEIIEIMVMTELQYCNCDCQEKMFLSSESEDSGYQVVTCSATQTHRFKLVKWSQKIPILKSKSLRLPILEDEFSACSVVVHLFDHMMGQLILMKNNPKIENVIANNKVMNGF